MIPANADLFIYKQDCIIMAGRIGADSGGTPYILKYIYKIADADFSHFYSNLGSSSDRSETAM